MPNPLKIPFEVGKVADPLDEMDWTPRKHPMEAIEDIRRFARLCWAGRFFTRISSDAQETEEKER